MWNKCGTDVASDVGSDVGSMWDWCGINVGLIKC